MEKNKSSLNGTKYPILLVHGMGMRDRKRLCYWGRIPAHLRQMGCAVYHGGQDANGSIEDNAALLKQTVEKILSETGCGKVNIIAHSKGGLEARYMICHLGMEYAVASLTTLSTPHNGSRTVDFFLRMPKWMVRAGCAVTDLIMRVGGDKKPETYKSVLSLSTEYSEEFNRNTPAPCGILCQSYAFVMGGAGSDLLILLPYLVVRAIEGENDGLLTPDAVKWESFRGIVRGAGRRGISHYDEIDMRRRRLSPSTGDGVSDIVEFYADLAAELASLGY